MNKKKALIVISFGSTFDDTRKKDIDGIAAALAEAFPAYDLYQAFTSNIIRNILAKRNIFIDSVESILQKLVTLGYEEILIQPTHLLHGEEFEQKILAIQNKYSHYFHKFTISKPLITFEEDYHLTAAVLVSMLPPLHNYDGVVFMGHGTPRSNNNSYGRTYNKLQQTFDEMQQPILVGTVEEADSPNLKDILQAIQQRGYKHIHLFPLMVVAGDHATSDMYGEEESSWKSQIEALGITTTGHLSGMGRYKAVQALYIHHTLRALSLIEKH